MPISFLFNIWGKVCQRSTLILLREFKVTVTKIVRKAGFQVSNSHEMKREADSYKIILFPNIVAR
eukprot:UN15393